MNVSPPSFCGNGGGDCREIPLLQRESIGESAGRGEGWRMIILVGNLLLAETGAAVARDAASLLAGRLVMLGFVALVMLLIAGFVLHLRKHARQPRRELDDLEQLAEDEESTGDEENWR